MLVRDALDVPMAQTLAFVREAVAPGAAVLEIGCGDGRLAAALADDGIRTVAIDSDPEAVAAARARAVDAHVASFPPGPEGPFDAVLFTRSLHHVGDLEGGVAAAARCLKPGGSLLVEDQAWDAMDEPLLEFCAQMAGWAAAAGAVVDDDWDTGAAGLRTWMQQHEQHGLHTGRAMDAALRRSFLRVNAARVAYAYRYPSRYLAGNPAGVVVAEAALALEHALVEAGALRFLGRRWCCRNRSRG